MTGKVWILSEVEIAMQRVELKITGFESTKVMKRDLDNHRDVTQSEKNEILNSTPASYGIPFRVMLPEVPGSFSESDGGKFEANIAYTISAICTPWPGKQEFYVVEYRRPFYVVEKQKEDVTAQKVKYFNIYSLRCILKGTCRISVSAKNAVVFPGMLQKAICDISNGSTIDIKEVELSIQKDFKVRANGHEHTYSRQVAMKKYEGPLKRSQWLDRTLSINVPVDLTPTTNSTLIQSNYRTEVKLMMKECGVHNNVVELPLTMYPTSQLEVAQPPLDRGKDMNQESETKESNGLSREDSVDALPTSAQHSLSESNHNKRPLSEMERGQSDESDPFKLNPRSPKRAKKENSSPPG